MDGVLVWPVSALFLPTRKRIKQNVALLLGGTLDATMRDLLTNLVVALGVAVGAEGDEDWRQRKW